MTKNSTSLKSAPSKEDKIKALKHVHAKNGPEPSNNNVGSMLKGLDGDKRRRLLARVLSGMKVAGGKGGMDVARAKGKG